MINWMCLGLLTVFLSTWLWYFLVWQTCCTYFNFHLNVYLYFHSYMYLDLYFPGTLPCLANWLDLFQFVFEYVFVFLNVIWSDFHQQICLVWPTGCVRLFVTICVGVFICFCISRCISICISPAHLACLANWLYLLRFVFEYLFVFLNLFQFSHLETPANGQAVVFLTGLLEVFISEISLFSQQYRTIFQFVFPRPIWLVWPTGCIY